MVELAGACAVGFVVACAVAEVGLYRKWWGNEHIRFLVVLVLADVFAVMGVSAAFASL